MRKRKLCKNDIFTIYSLNSANEKVFRNEFSYIFKKSYLILLLKKVAAFNHFSFKFFPFSWKMRPENSVKIIDSRHIFTI
jgi:hypothetical protein